MIGRDDKRARMKMRGDEAGMRRVGGHRVPSPLKGEGNVGDPCVWNGGGLEKGRMESNGRDRATVPSGRGTGRPMLSTSM